MMDSSAFESIGLNFYKNPPIAAEVWLRLACVRLALIQSINYSI